MLNPYWTPEITARSQKAKTFAELSLVGQAVLLSMPSSVVFICGPVSSGGAGSIEANLAQLSNTINRFIGQGENVFDQTPFEAAIARLRAHHKDIDGLQLLEEFYLPLFKLGCITEMRFLPDWQSSVGATWERRQAEQLNIKITDIRL